MRGLAAELAERGLKVDWPLVSMVLGALMRANPGDTAEQFDGKRRDRPDDELDPAGMLPFGPVDARALDSRNQWAKTRIAAIVGSTIASMIAIESLKTVFSAAAIGPFGSRIFMTTTESAEKAMSTALPFNRPRGAPEHATIEPIGVKGEHCVV